MKKINKTNKNKNKMLGVIGLLLAFILLSSVMSSADDFEGRPGFLKRIGQSWGSSLTSWIPFFGGAEEGEGDIYNWYNDTFFTLEKWEIDVCLVDLSTNVREFRDSTTTYGFGYEDNIYTTTLTLAATKKKFNETEWLYKISWYLMPYNFDIPYRVYLVDDQGNLFFPPNNDEDWIDAPRYTGKSGFETFYSNIIYKQAVLEYNETTHKEFKVDIVEKEV